MPTSSPYVAECLWPGVTPSDVAALERRLALHPSSTARHVGTTLVPTDEVVFVWFDSSTEVAVRTLCLAASVPFDRVVAVTGWPVERPHSPPERTRS